MSKANESAYPLNHDRGTEYADGLSKRDKLAMEIYVARMPALINNITTAEFEMEALASLRAADIFFEQLNK